jgi:hypothetical protein
VGKLKRLFFPPYCSDLQCVQFKSRWLCVIVQSVQARWLRKRGSSQAWFLFTGYWEEGGAFTGLKRLGCEDDHSQTSSMEVMNAWRCAFTLSHAFIGVVLY